MILSPNIYIMLKEIFYHPLPPKNSVILFHPRILFSSPSPQQGDSSQYLSLGWVFVKRPPTVEDRNEDKERD